MTTEDFTLKRQSDYSPPPCQDHDRRLALIEQTMGGIRAANEQMVNKLDLLLTQMTKIALLEERHLSQQTDLNRAHDRIGELSKALTAHVNSTEAFINYSKGRDRVLWTLSAAVGILVLKAVFFASSHGVFP